MSRKPLVVANWKMNSDLAFIDSFFSKWDYSGKGDIVFCPPYPYLYSMSTLSNKVSGFSVGAQNLCYEEDGAYTGEVSAKMLRDFSCSYVIIGHSERRKLFGESDADVSKKLKQAVLQDIEPILCVGETLEERDNDNVVSVIQRQLESLLPVADSSFTLAYEPVWAIGTGKTATPSQAQDVHSAIREWLVDNVGVDKASATRILYGGSVKPNNAEELFREKDIDGGLIGGASLSVEDFISICKAADL